MISSHQYQTKSKRHIKPEAEKIELCYTITMGKEQFPSGKMKGGNKKHIHETENHIKRNTVMHRDECRLSRMKCSTTN